MPLPVRRQLVQGRRSVSSPSQFYFSNCHENIRPPLQILGFKKRLLLFRAARAHHRQSIDERLIGGAVDTVPIDVQVVRLGEVTKRTQNAVAIDLILARVGAEINDKWAKIGAALAIGCYRGNFLAKLKPCNTS